MSTIVKRAAALTAVTALAAVLVSAPAQAEPADGAPGLSGLGEVVDKAVAEQLEDGAVPGAAVSIVSGGEVVHSRGYGYADLDSKTKVDPESTGFYTASVAKLFTAAAVLQLEAEKKLDLDADVNEYLDFDIPDTYPGKPVTLEHLLTHTSGFDPDYGMVGKSVSDPEQLGSLKDSLIEYRPARVEPPGTLIAYDNYGLALAGYIVERVAKVPYDEYVNEHVYGALDMTGSTATQPHPDEIAENLATGYRPDGDTQTVTRGNYDAWSPSGPGQVVTAADMSKFMIDQLADESALGEGIPQDLMTRQYTQYEGMPGMGFVYEERPVNGETIWFKGGDGTGYHTDMVLLPERELGIYFTVNGDGNDDFDLGAVSQTVIDTYFPAPGADKPKAVSNDDVPQYAGVYQSSRISRHSIIKLRAIGQSRVVVTANADGTLTTTDRTLSSKDDADSQKWVQIAPGEFQEANGPGTIAFKDGVLTQTQSQNQAYVKQPWYESPVLHQNLVIAALVVLVLGLVWLPFLALRRRDNPRGAKLARLLAWSTSAAAITSTVVLVLLMSNRDAAIEALAMGAPLAYALMVGATVTLVGAAGMAVAALAAWIRGWWRIPGRLSYTLLTVAAVVFATIAFTYNLTGPPFD